MLANDLLGMLVFFILFYNIFGGPIVEHAFFQSTFLITTCPLALDHLFMSTLGIIAHDFSWKYVRKNLRQRWNGEIKEEGNNVKTVLPGIHR